MPDMPDPTDSTTPANAAYAAVPPLILASASMTRKQMLDRAGLRFAIKPADIDETDITHNMQQRGESHYSIVSMLSMKKAHHIAGQNPAALVIGSDQILVHDNRILHKSPDRESAAQKLRNLMGKTHHLISAVTVMRGDDVLWSHTESAALTMRTLDDATLESYLDRAGAGLMRSVGAYELEGHGAWLFEKVDGDFFTILGMPLLPLLGFLGTDYMATSTD